MNLSAFYLIGMAYGWRIPRHWLPLVGCWPAGGNAVAQQQPLSARFLVCALSQFLNITMERLLGPGGKALGKTKVAGGFFTILVLAMVSLQFLNPLMQKYGHALVPMLRSWCHILWLLPSSFRRGCGCSSALTIGLWPF